MFFQRERELQVPAEEAIRIENRPAYGLIVRRAGSESKLREHHQAHLLGRRTNVRRAMCVTSPTTGSRRLKC